MVTISLCMIVKNEEAVLERCLDSVADVVDEIIIVDTGSTDATKQIAAKFTDKIFDFPWIEDFSAARNFAYDRATMDYQMWLDADDVLPPAEREKLRTLKHILSPRVDMVTMKYITHYDAHGNPILTSRRERLTRRSKNFRWQDPVHECIPLGGNIEESDITIEHRKERQEGISFRNLHIYQKLEQSGAELTPRQLYYYARELRDHRMFPEAIGRFEKFLDSERGWTEDNIAACHALALCYRAEGDEYRAFQALLRGFTYAGPRAELVCEIGYHFKMAHRYAEAAEWFLVATHLPEPTGGGFILKDYWGYIPHIELCVCYYTLGMIDKARHHNEIAGTFKPGDLSVKRNDDFFGTLN